jgi:hypothetical protein
MTKYTLKKDDQHGFILCKDGKEVICPFQPAIAQQTNLGGLAVMRIPCSTSCALVDHVQYNTPAGSVNEYVMNCAKGEKTVEIDEENELPTLKLI